MAQIPLKKIRCVIANDSASSLVARLHDEGAVQIIDTIPDEYVALPTQEHFEHRTKSAELESVVSFLAQYEKSSGMFRPMFEGSSVVTTKKRVTEIADSYNADEVVQHVHTLRTRLIEIDAEMKSLDEEERTVRSWERLTFPLSEITDTKHTIVFPIHGTAREIDVLTGALTEKEDVALERVSETALLVVAHYKVEQSIQEILREKEVEVLRLPKTQHTAAEELERIGLSRDTLNKERATLVEDIGKIAEQELPSLRHVADNALWNSAEIDTLAKLPASKHVRVFDAWVPAPTWKKLETSLSEEFPTSAFEEIPLAESEQPPTFIKNQGLVGPFEFVTRLYGVPGHTDLDPTPFLAGFFFLFFGLCLSDFGYGVTLMILTALPLLKYKIFGGMRQLLITLFFGGLGAAIAGALYGGYFGVSAASIHPALASLQLFDPIGNPMPVFFLALGVGVLQVIVGIILDIVRGAKNNDIVNAILDNGPWLFLFVVVIAYVIGMTGILPEALSQTISKNWTYAGILAAALISLSQARLGKNILDGILKGFLALYGGVNYFSDILSYSRLLALGLATSALGFSVNLIASIVGGDTLGIGTFFAILILLAGHTLNITLSSLGAFIHSSRLQYVEFFGKFLKGTGKPFAPFARKTKHTILLPEKSG